MEQITTYQAFRRHARPILAGLSLGLCLLLAQNAFAAPAQSLEKEAQTCAKAIAYQERGQAIPKGLLHAISMAESGRWNADNEAIVAWPWTVTTGGQGHFLPNRADAVAFVKSLQADGVENIDVGCMQINLKYHPDAFVSIEHAFDPNANAAYAATFLKERFGVNRSWMQAAGDYHST
ncbi:murein transglycosylase, partial [Pseudomonadota bacterium]